MTSRERLLCAMRGGTPDRVPVGPFGLGRIDPASELAEELIERTDILIDAGGGIDAFLGTWPDREWRTEGDTTTVTVRTPLGPLVREVRRTAVTSATVRFPFQSPEDVERFLSVPWELPEPDPSHYRGWCERVGDRGLVLAGIGSAICLAAEWFSPEGFSLAWADCPDLLADLTEEAARRLNASVEALCRAGVEAFRIVGGEYVSVQLGPRAFARLVTPIDSALIDVIHRHGGVAYYHNHGPVMRYLPALSDLGMDALDPLEAPPWGDVDLRKARDLVRPDLCFVGNLDDMEVVDALPTDDVLRIAAERLEAGGPRAFVLGGTASGSYGERGARNFIAMAGLVG